MSRPQKKVGMGGDDKLLFNFTWPLPSKVKDAYRYKCWLLSIIVHSVDIFAILDVENTNILMWRKSVWPEKYVLGTQNSFTSPFLGCTVVILLTTFTILYCKVVWLGKDRHYHKLIFLSLSLFLLPHPLPPSSHSCLAILPHSFGLLVSGLSTKTRCGIKIVLDLLLSFTSQRMQSRRERLLKVSMHSCMRTHNTKEHGGVTTLYQSGYTRVIQH